jgi:hypothetical protein
VANRDRYDDLVDGIEVKKEKKNSGMPLIFTWIASFILFIISIPIECSMTYTIVFGLIALALFVPAVYFGFAKENICFTIVNEGTAKIVTSGGAAVDALLQYKDHVMDREYNISVEKGAVQPSFFGLGGLRFYGIWPFRQIYTYKFSWSSIDQDGGKDRHIEEELDYVLVKPTIYGTDLRKVETKYSERIPLDIQFLFTMRIVNPYKILFSAPPNWNEKLLARLNGFLRGWVANKEMDEVLSLKGSPQTLWNDLVASDFSASVDYFLNHWGIKLEINGIDLRNVHLPEEYQRAAAAGRRMELESAGVASQTVGMIITSMAKSRGKTPKEIQEMINNDANLQEQFMKMARDLLERKMAIDGGSLVDVRVGGAEGFEKTLLQLLAAAKKMGSKNS